MIEADTHPVNAAEVLVMKVLVIPWLFEVHSFLTAEGKGFPNMYGDLPLILILSVYTDVLPLELVKIQVFFLTIW